MFFVLNPIFEETFIPASFSCRVGFGTHKGVDFLEREARSVGRNGTADCFVLKCDIKKFFDSVDHGILLEIMEKRIKDEDAVWLLKTIVKSYETAPVGERDGRGGARGIPIGNLTSQLFANVYMNEFDQFMKHGLRAKHYARYTDDYAIASSNREELENVLNPASRFLHDRLFLTLHPQKVSIRKLHQGIDFLGYVFFDHHRLVRSKTRRRMFKRFKTNIAAWRAGAISDRALGAALSSYRGVLSHANALRTAEEMENLIWFSNN
jgi:retron-type reverse transcriptase